MTSFPPSVAERLTARGRREGDCLIWTGAAEVMAGGYTRGSIRIRKKTWRVSRAAWVLANGPIPPDKPCVLHRCDNALCYEIEHLFLGTQGDNMADKVSKGRARGPRPTHCPRDHPYDEANTYRTRSGKRQCRTCNQERARRYYLDRRRAS